MRLIKTLSLGLFLQMGFPRVAQSCEQWLAAHWRLHPDLTDIVTYSFQVGKAPLEQVQTLRPGLSFSVVNSQEAYDDLIEDLELPRSLLKTVGQGEHSIQDFQKFSGGLKDPQKLLAMERVIDEMVGPLDQELLQNFKKAALDIFARFGRTGRDFLFVTETGSKSPALVMLIPDYRAANIPNLAAMAIVLSISEAK